MPVGYAYRRASFSPAPGRKRPASLLSTFLPPGEGGGTCNMSCPLTERNTAFLLGCEAATVSSLGMTEVWLHSVLVPDFEPSTSLPLLSWRQRGGAHGMGPAGSPS